MPWIKTKLNEAEMRRLRPYLEEKGASVYGLLKELLFNELEAWESRSYQDAGRGHVLAQEDDQSSPKAPSSPERIPEEALEVPEDAGRDDEQFTPPIVPSEPQKPLRKIIWTKKDLEEEDLEEDLEDLDEELEQDIHSLRDLHPATERELEGRTKPLSSINIPPEDRGFPPEDGELKRELEEAARRARKTALRQRRLSDG